MGIPPDSKSLTHPEVLMINRSRNGGVAAERSLASSCCVPSAVYEGWKLHRLRRFEVDLKEIQAMECPQRYSADDHSVEFASGSTYKGEWAGCARHGFGVQTWPDGPIYAGEWK